MFMVAKYPIYFIDWYLYLLNFIHKSNRIGGVKASVLSSSVEGRGF